MSIRERIENFEQGFYDHAKRIARFEEGPADLILAATAKFQHFLRRVFRPKHRKESIHFVKLGITAYNSKKYDSAEKHFKSALERDGTYARAALYLGNTYYKTNELVEAMKMWNQAVKSERRSDAGKKAAEKLAQYGPRIHKSNVEN